MPKHLLFLWLWLCRLAVFSQQLRFNEVMISNVDGLLVDNDFPDSWIELHNRSDKTIDIKGYSVQQIVSGKVERYMIPVSCPIVPNGYTLIYCDKNANGVHTSFKLDADGGRLQFFDVQMHIVDEMEYPKMIAPGVGYGRNKAHADLWQWETVSTPGQANEGVFTDVLLPNPVFSMEGRVMSQPETLTITLPDDPSLPADTKIYVTYNGQEPSVASVAGKSFTVNIDKSMVVRAKLISQQALSRPSLTHSYIFHPRQTQIPILSLATDDAYLYDAKKGIFSHDTVSNNMPNYWQKWRRPVNMEYLGIMGDSPLFNQLGETAVAGGASRMYPQKSLKFYAGARFGKKRIKGILWSDKPGLDKNKSFMIRNGGSFSTSTRIADAFIQTLFGRHVNNLDWQAYSPVICYINGQYKGVFGLRERTNEDFVWANYDGNDDIDRVESPLETSNAAFNEFRKVFQNPNATFHDIEALMDMDEFVNYLCLETFSANDDWPGHNVSIWKWRNNGKWRWITKDVDCVGNSMNPNVVDDPLHFNSLWFLTGLGSKDSQEYKLHTYSAAITRSVEFFKVILQMPEFRDQMVDRMAVYLGDFLKPSVTCPLLRQMREEILDEVGCTWELYYPNKSWGKGYLVFYTDKTIDFLQKRPRIMYEQLADFYHLGNVIPMSIETSNNEVSMNHVRLTEGDFSGCCFSRRTFSLSSGSPSIGWEMRTYKAGDAGSENTYVFNQPSISLCMCNFAPCDSVSFVPRVIDVEQFVNTCTDNVLNTTQLECFSASGSRISNQSGGVQIIRTSDGVVSKILRKK